MKKRVLLGMSGGVDSSVSAILLKKQGYEVIGATMKLWTPENEEEGQSTCCGEDSIRDAKRVCDKLDIPHYVFNLKKEFKCNVVDNFIKEYEEGRTPNPCIECNRYLKFRYFYQKAKELGCEYIATGHYAKREYSEKYNRYVLRKSNESKKDQTYFLYNIPKEEIEKIIFPLQDFQEKKQIRQIAEENGLLISQKKDSQEICFIPDNDYTKFIKKYLAKKIKSGNIVLTDGTILGKHTGLINYTIGQRKGLGVSYKEPLYVVELNKKNNEVIVGTEKELYSKELYANDLNFLVMDEIPESMEVKAKIRYRAKEAEATIYKENEKTVKVVFKEQQRAITLGQSVVFYDNEGILIGGGKICVKTY